MSDLDILRTTVRSFLRQHAPVRAQLSDDGSAWKRLTSELGLTGLAVPAELGGSGGTFVDLAMVLEEAGRTLLRAPLLPTAVAACALADLVSSSDRAARDDVHPAETALAGLLDGSSTAALALGAEVAVVDGRLQGRLPQVPHGGADLLLVGCSAGLLLVEHPEASHLVCVDPTRPQAEVRFNGSPFVHLGDPARTRLLHQVALASECVGGARRCLELAVDHLLVREQFGRPLGSFQALRHRVADLTVRLEAATSAAWYAARAAAGLTDDLAVAAPLALATCTEAFTLIAGESIQLHGGIGFTWEHDAHLFFKRAWSTSLLHGDPTTLRRQAYDAHLDG